VDVTELAFVNAGVDGPETEWKDAIEGLVISPSFGRM
jgi:hypothetical protein